MTSSNEALLQLLVHELPTRHQMLSQLLQAESLHRREQRTAALIPGDCFRYSASIEELSFAAKRNLVKDHILALADCSYVGRAESLLITIATRGGKNFVASALGYQVCLMDYKVRYLNMNKLAETPYQSKADGSLVREFLRIVKYQLLLLDDFGL